MVTGDEVRVEVRMGMGLRRPAAAPRRTMTVAAGTTVGALIERLAAEEPTVAAGFGAALVVIDGSQVGRDRPVVDGDRVAFVLPVSGGAPPMAPPSHSAAGYPRLILKERS